MTEHTHDFKIPFIEDLNGQFVPVAPTTFGTFSSQLIACECGEIKYRLTKIS